MDKSAPKYSEYSYKELLDVREHIDRERFPERLKVVENLIATKSIEESKPNEENSFDDKTMMGVLAGELLIWIIVGVLTLLGYLGFR